MQQLQPVVTGPRDTMTLTELAERLGISITKAYQMAARDELPVPAIRIGRTYHFSRRLYEQLLDSPQRAPVRRSA